MADNEPVKEVKEEVKETITAGEVDFRIPKTIHFNPITREHTPEKEEPKVETPAAEEEKKVEPVKEEPKAEGPAKVIEEPKKEEPVKVEPAKEEKPVFEIASPIDAIKKLDEYSVEKFGIPYQDAMNFKNTKHEELDELDIVDTAYRLEDPEITEVEIEAKNLKFAPIFETKEEQDKMIEDGKITREQLTMLDAEFEGIKRKALQTINKAKQAINFDEIKFTQKNEQPEPVKVNEEQIAAMKDAVTKVLADLKQDKFVVKDKEGKEWATINVDMPDSAKVVEIASDPNSIYKLWLDEKGNFDVAKFTRDVARLINMDKSVEVSYFLGVNKGKEIEGKDGANVVLDHKAEAIHKQTPKITPHQVVLGNIT